MKKDNIKINEFLNSKDFEKESNNMLGSFHTIVKPRFIEGFIYSFFEDFNHNPDLKRRLIFKMDDLMIPRDSNLFDAKTKIIILSKEEIDLINSILFTQKLKNIYEGLFINFDAFHRKFIGKNNLSLAQFYNYIINFFNDNGIYKKQFEFNGAYYENCGKIKNVNALKILLFKDEIHESNLAFISYLQEKIKQIENQFPTANITDDSNIMESNPFPDIFKKLNTYNSFVEYKKHIIEPFIDYSYLIQRLLFEKLIHKKSHFEFMDWLLKEKFITDKTHHKMKVERNFRSLEKSSSIQRENNFNNIFEI